MIYRYTKCESVIAKIMADANLSEKDMRITDIREWIFEAVESIGAPMQYISKESGVDDCPILKIEDHQVPIPEDLETLQAVAYSPSKNGAWQPARQTDATFKNLNNTIKVGGRYTHKPEQPMRYKEPTTLSQVYTEMSRSTDQIVKQRMLTTDPTYFVKPGWVVLNKPAGYVKLAYKSVATDERGYPLIPDLVSYQEAIYWYVMMKLNFPKFLTGSLGGRSKYNFNTYSYLQQQWHFYRNKAYAEAMMPNEGAMETIKNEWNKLVPELDSSDTFFINNGAKEEIYNDYYNG